jgi:hypothetical protein
MRNFHLEGIPLCNQTGAFIMKRYLTQMLGLSVALTAILPFSQAAQAASFAETQTEVDWLIHNDSFNDSIAGNDVGGTRYEMYSTAVQVVDNFLVFGIRSNFTMNGTTSQFAHDGLVKFSDIILKCTDHMFGQVAQYGIRFDGGNESPVATGIYEDPTFTSVAARNGNLTGSFGGYNSYVAQNGGTPTVGTLSNADFDASTHLPNLLTGGNRIGDAFVLSEAQKQNLGLNLTFANMPGFTTAIAADISQLQELGASCSFYLGQECNNDPTGGGFEVAKVPEPTSWLALAALGVLLPMAKRRKLAA